MSHYKSITIKESNSKNQECFEIHMNYRNEDGCHGEYFTTEKSNDSTLCILNFFQDLIKSSILIEVVNCVNHESPIIKDFFQKCIEEGCLDDKEKFEITDYSLCYIDIHGAVCDVILHE